MQISESAGERFFDEKGVKLEGSDVAYTQVMMCREHVRTFSRKTLNLFDFFTILGSKLDPWNLPKRAFWGSGPAANFE